MGKSVNSEVLDAASDVIINNCDMMTVCNAEPATRADALTNYMLVQILMSSGSFTKAANSPSGRKLIVGATTSSSAINSGTGTHIAFIDATRLLYVTTCASQVITAGNLINTPQFDILKIQNPT